MTRNFYADDINRLERRINRLERRGQWGGAERTSIAEFDLSLDLVTSPGDETTQIAYISLDPGRWDIFGSLIATCSGEGVVACNLRVVDELGWDGTLTSISTNRDTTIADSRSFGASHWVTPHVFTTVVLDHPMYATLNCVRLTVSTATTITVRVAQLFAKPG